MNNRKGFTLIELIIVIAIIGVFATVLVPTMMNYVKKSKIAAGIAETKSIVTACNVVLADAATEGLLTNLNKSIKVNGVSETCGVITNWSVSKALKNETSSDLGQATDIKLAKGILEYIDSEDLNNSLYDFTGQTYNPIGDVCKTFYNRYKSPGVIIVYNEGGSVLLVEYYNNGVLTHYQNGEFTSNLESNAKFVGYDVITY